MTTQFDFDDDDVQTLEAEEELGSEKKSGLSGKKIAIIGGSAAGVLVLVASAFFTGLIVGGSDSDSSSPSQVTSIRSSNSVLNQLESLKDSQIDTLNDQLSRVLADGSLSQSGGVTGENDKELAAYMGTIKDDQKVIDSFLSNVMALKPTATDKDIQVVVNAISSDVAGTVGASGTYNMVSGDSAAKMIGAEGRKGSDSMFYLADINNSTRTYVVVTPFVTEDKVTNQVSVMTISQQKISNYKFIGLLESENPDDFAKTVAEFVSAVDAGQ